MSMEQIREDIRLAMDELGYFIGGIESSENTRRALKGLDAALSHLSAPVVAEVTA